MQDAVAIGKPSGVPLWLCIWYMIVENAQTASALLPPMCAQCMELDTEKLLPALQKYFSEQAQGSEGFECGTARGPPDQCSLHMGLDKLDKRTGAPQEGAAGASEKGRGGGFASGWWQGLGGKATESGVR